MRGRLNMVLTAIEESETMAEQSVMNVNENTPEYVAYRLMRDILVVEKRSLEELSRDDLLNTYAECLKAVQGKRAAAPSGTRKK